MGSLVLVLDLVGTFVFALAGATAGVRRQLDIFGVAVLCFALRMIAIHRGWELPRAKSPDDRADDP